MSDGVSNHQLHDFLLKRLFRRRSKKTTKLCDTGLCAGNSPVTGEFPAQMASNAENVSIWWWRHQVLRFWRVGELQKLVCKRLTQFDLVEPYGDKEMGGSTLARLMACFLTAPSHFLNPCWLLIHEVLWHSTLEKKFTANGYVTDLYNKFEIHAFNNFTSSLIPHLPGTNKFNVIQW